MFFNFSDFTGQIGSSDYLSLDSPPIVMGLHVSPEVKSRVLPKFREKLGIFSQRTLAKEFGVGKTTANRWARELGFVPVRHSVDENFFDSWNEYSSYILGYAFADGNVAWNLEKSYWTFTISACEKDAAHLERMRLLLKSSKPLLYSPKTKSYRLKATSRILCKKLIRKGVIPKKSLVVRFPDVPEGFLRHFIRGVVDGDGTVRFFDRKRSPYFEISICSGSIAFLQGLASRIRHAYGIPANVRAVAAHLFVVGYSCSRGEKLAQILYEDSNIFLQRKFDAFLALKEHRRSTHD